MRSKYCNQIGCLPKMDKRKKAREETLLNSLIYGNDPL